MKGLLIIFAMLSISIPTQARDCREPHLGSAMAFLVSDKESDLIEAKEKETKIKLNLEPLSKVLKYLGFITSESQEKFSQKLKSDTGWTKDDDNAEDQKMTVEAYDYYLFGGESEKQNLLVLRIQASSFGDYFFYVFRREGASYAIVDQTPIDIYSKYCEPVPEYYFLNGRNYISTMGAGGGTGVLECGGELDEIGKGKVKKVLDYPYSGDWYPGGNISFDVDYASGPITCLN